MTVLRTMRRRVKRWALIALIAAGSTATSLAPAAAQETHDSGELCGWVDDLRELSATPDAEPPSPPNHSATPEFFSVTVGKELSISTCNYDAWLADTLASAKPGPAKRVAASRTSSDFDTTLSSIVPQQVDRRVSLDQFAEPFVAVASEVQTQLLQRIDFRSLFGQSPFGKDLVVNDLLDKFHFSGSPALDSVPPAPLAQSAWPRDFVPVVDFTGELDDDHPDGIVLTETRPEPNADAAPGTDPLVGSSPIIASIKEAYLPYDLAERDRDDLDVREINSQTQNPTFSAQVRFGSPDCWLDELVYQFDATLEDYRVAKRKLRPGKLGKRIASLVVSGDRLASRVAEELALVWPVAKQPVEPAPGAGARLLARAQAVERLDAEQIVEDGSAEPISPEQLAQARATLLQWVDVAQSVIDDVSKRLPEVAEVARHRGTQDDSARR